jgi:hypothetical protein
MKHWRGVTYPCSRWLPNFVYWVWKHTCCKHGWHLLDEMISAGDKGVEHSLICDACEIKILIKDEDGK